MKNESISTQIRLPVGIYEYIKEKSAEMGISQNSFLIILLNQGKKLWEAEVNFCLEAK